MLNTHSGDVIKTQPKEILSNKLLLSNATQLFPPLIVQHYPEND